MGMDVTTVWDGGFVPATRSAAVKGLNMAAEELLGASRELSPVDTGDNRRSSSIQEATDGDLTAWVMYNMPYSVMIHEDLSMNFSTAKNPLAQAKFLEGPLIRDKDLLVGIVQAQIRRVYQ